MQIRKMTIADYDRVYELWMSCAGMGLNNLDDSREGIKMFLRRNPETCLVAEENDAIVGVILIGNDGRRGYIYHTAVHPNERRKGIAAQLVNSGLTELSALGINKVALVVFGRNEVGNEFWQSQGFTVRDDIVYRNKALVDMVRVDT
jgi:ribosomal protein S18 acetylase RimI-like enzyme